MFGFGVERRPSIPLVGGGSRPVSSHILERAPKAQRYPGVVHIGNPNGSIGSSSDARTETPQRPVKEPPYQKVNNTQVTDGMCDMQVGYPLPTLVWEH
jgi:hypothetical protein